jgi:hypothetical protein
MQVISLMTDKMVPGLAKGKIRATNFSNFS